MSKSIFISKLVSDKLEKKGQRKDLQELKCFWIFFEIPIIMLQLPNNNNNNEI